MTDDRVALPRMLDKDGNLTLHAGCGQPASKHDGQRCPSGPDDRVTFPLTKTRAAAELLHSKVCWIAGNAHNEACLMPLLAERDLAMATTYLATSISGDCMDPVKHDACSGCACHHHTLKTGRMR